MVVSLIYDKCAIPVYIQILNKQGSSNLEEQKQVLEPVIRPTNSQQNLVSSLILLIYRINN